MRIRNAAIAGATALAVAFGGTTVATAQDNPEPIEYNSPFSSSNFEGSSLPSKIGDDLDKDKEANGRAIFGSSKDLASQPAWAKVLYAGTVIGAIGAVLGGVIGPVYNFFVHGPSF